MECEFTLKPFTKTGSTEVKGLISLNENEITIDFHLNHPPKDLIWPQQSQTPSFRHELWKSTCFEIFLKFDDSSSYFEWNFSPSGDWACYEFSAYREKKRDIHDEKPLIRTALNDHQLTLCSRIPLNSRTFKEISYKPCCVLRTKEQISYWSLEHYQPQPDFHDPQGFIQSRILL